MRVQDLPGERIGPYRLLRRLGEGGMGVVYLATGPGDQQLAVKVLRPDLAGDEHARRRLAREVETMRRVRSRHVAEVVDADVTCDPPYIVTRFVPGLTLDAVVRGGGPLTGAPLARLARGLAEALQAIHAAGVVHRDLKPGNVMIADGEPVVIDFGIAQLPDTTRLTMTGMFMGTPGYLAPEVIEGKDSSPAADVHSWGATIAFAATGRPPFGSGNYETIFFRIIHGRPDLDTLPAVLRPVVLRTLARDPAARPAAAELRHTVATFDPAALVPSARAAAPISFDHLASTAAGGGGGVAAAPSPAAGPIMPPVGLRTLGHHSTKPLGAPVSQDVRDLLPPVQYGPPAGSRNGLANGLAGPARPADGIVPSGRSELADNAPASLAPLPAGPAMPPPGATANRAASGVSPWSPLVLAVVAMAVAVSVLAPIIGTVTVLTVLLALRAAGITSRRLARRRSGDGRTAGGSLAGVAYYPLAVLRSLIGLLLLAPVALLGFGLAAAVTIIAVPLHPLPRAVAFGAGTVVAIVGAGPGSGTSRAVLARLFSAAAGTPSRRAVAYVGVLALAVWAGLQAIGQPAAYWPVSLHQRLLHLPTVHSVLFDVRLNLLRLVRRFGF